MPTKTTKQVATAEDVEPPEADDQECDLCGQMAVTERPIDEKEVVLLCASHENLKIKEIQHMLGLRNDPALDRTQQPAANRRPRPTTPRRGIRVKDDLWERAHQKAQEKDETVSDAIRRFLEEYAK